MVVVATRSRRTHQTRTSPLVKVQLFQKLGGWMLFVILKKVIYLVFIYMVQFCTCISVTPCIYKNDQLKLVMYIGNTLCKKIENLAKFTGSLL